MEKNSKIFFMGAERGKHFNTDKNWELLNCQVIVYQNHKKEFNLIKWQLQNNMINPRNQKILFWY